MLDGVLDVLPRMVSGAGVTLGGKLVNFIFRV
jgi:hypothetical protein